MFMLLKPILTHVLRRPSEFIRLVSSEANEVCEKSSKKTIAPEHVVTALKELGFETFIGDIEEVLKEHNTQVKVGTFSRTKLCQCIVPLTYTEQDRERKMSRMEHSGYSAEELQRQQELLFAASRARYEASN